MDENTAFLEKASQLFIENGAKSLTMDDVAAEFGISKKTLYQKHRNKEELLAEVLRYKLKNVITKLKNIDATVENAIERMFCRDHELEEATQQNNSIFLRQLIKYYPAIFNSHMLDFSDEFSGILEQNIELGREQGCYRKDFDAKLYSKIFFQMAMSYDSSPFFDVNAIDRQHYMKEVLLFFLNAIATEEGKQIIKKLNTDK